MPKDKSSARSGLSKDAVGWVTAGVGLAAGSLQGLLRDGARFLSPLCSPPPVLVSVCVGSRRLEGKTVAAALGRPALRPCHPRDEQMSFLEVLAKTLEGFPGPLRSQ